MTPTVVFVDPALTRELRRSVLRPHLPAGAALPGDDLPGAVHLAAVDEDGAALATCFVYPDPCPWLPGPAWHLRQMATLPALRGQGLGGAVVEAAAAHTGAAGARLLWCHARETAVAFYRRHDFQVHGEVFTDDRHPIPHRRMWRELGAAATSSTG